MRFSTLLLLASIRLETVVASSPANALLSEPYAQDDPQEVFDYWTPDRILATIPPEFWKEGPDEFDFEVSSAAASLRAHDHGRRLVDFTKGVAFPHPPQANAEQTKVQKAVGALVLLSASSGKDGWCSATVIQDLKDDRSLILTAAHCLCNVETGTWNKKFLFIPWQDDGKDTDKIRREPCSNDPFGCWTPQIVLIDHRFPKAKTDLARIAYDYGILVVPNDMKYHTRGKDGKDHKELDATAGALAVNDANDPNRDKEHSLILGYPRNTDPDLRFCDGFVAQIIGGDGKAFPENVFFIPKCNLAKGASGGPWIPNPVPASGDVFSVFSVYAHRNDGSLGPFLNHGYRCVYQAANSIPMADVLKHEGGVVHHTSPACQITFGKRCDVEDPTQQRKLNEFEFLPEEVIGCDTNGCTAPEPKCYGEPHFETWSGKRYDYMGGCDLVLIQAPNFGPGLTLDIHIRTKVRDFYSFIERAAIKIGSDVLEVASYGEYFLNGVDNATMPNVVAGFPVNHHQPSEKVILFEIDLGHGQSIQIKTFTVKDFVSVELKKPSPKRFHGSLGMLGDYKDGRLIGRDGVTALGQKGIDAFAAEWQVRDNEERLFQTNEYPQYPQDCVLPDPVAQKEHRQLLGKSVSLEDAQDACSHLSDSIKDDCVYDVMATGDPELATYAF